MKAILFHDLIFSYERNRPVLSIQDLSIGQGEHVFLHGPSGSGKTTLLGLITGVLDADQGSLQILGRDFRKESSASKDRFRSDRMGYIFQQFNLIPYMNVLDNILLTAWMSQSRSAKCLPSTPEIQAKILASRLGLTDLLSRSILELSVGQQQRVAVARALLGKPDLIIADEPTSALDENRQAEFIDLLLDQTKESGATVLFVSHNQRLAAHFDRSISLPDLNTMPRGPS